MPDEARPCPICGSLLFEKQACCWWKKHGWLTILRCSAPGGTCDYMEGLKMGEAPREKGGGNAGQV